MRKRLRYVRRGLRMVRALMRPGKASGWSRRKRFPFMARELACGFVTGGSHWFGESFLHPEDGEMVSCRICRSSRYLEPRPEPEGYGPPRPEDAYPLKPPHLEGCRGIPCGTGPDAFAFVKCVDGCPERAAAIRRGQALAKEHGW